MQCPAADDEQNTEDQKPDIPRNRLTKVVLHMMDAKYLVDQPLHDVGNLGRSGYAPACHRGGRSKPIVRPVAGKLAGSILIGLERAG